MGKNSFMDLGYGGHCQAKIYRKESVVSGL